MACGSRQPVIFKLINKFVGQTGFQANPGDHPIYLLHHDLFPHASLRAGHNALRAAEVVVPLLRLGRDEASALATAEEAAIQVGLQLRRLGLALPLHDLLHLIKCVLGNDWFMDAFVQFAIEIHQPIIEGTLEHRLVVRCGHEFPLAGAQAYFVNALAHLVQGKIAGGVKLKCLPHQRRFRRVNNHGPLIAIIQIANRRARRPDPVAQLLPATALDVLG